MDRANSFWTAVVAALSASASYSTPPRYRRMRGGDLALMRGDVERVGQYFGLVMAREHGNQPATR